MTLNEAIEFLAPCKLDNESATVWTDLGCGNGLFTYALASFLAPASHIYAIDKQTSFIRRNDKTKVEIDTLRCDFVDEDLPFPEVSGILMANALHYVKDQGIFIKKMNRYLQEKGIWVIIEYDTQKANAWIPYPVNFERLQELFWLEGYQSVVKISERRSIYNSANMYCAVVKQ